MFPLLNPLFDLVPASSTVTTVVIIQHLELDDVQPVDVLAALPVPKQTDDPLLLLQHAGTPARFLKVGLRPRVAVSDARWGQIFRLSCSRLAGTAWLTARPPCHKRQTDLDFLSHTTNITPPSLDFSIVEPKHARVGGFYYPVDIFKLKGTNKRFNQYALDAFFKVFEVCFQCSKGCFQLKGCSVNNLRPHLSYSKGPGVKIPHFLPTPTLHCLLVLYSVCEHMMNGAAQLFEESLVFRAAQRDMGP